MQNITNKIIHVAAGVLINDKGEVLLTSRPSDKIYAGYWEFPGGKLEQNESAINALSRELMEELGINVQHATPWLTKHFVYPHASVILYFFRVWKWQGKIQAIENQQFSWQFAHQILVQPILPANLSILRSLELPCVLNVCKKDEQTFAKNNWLKLKTIEDYVQQNQNQTLWLKIDFAKDSSLKNKPAEKWLGAQIENAKQLKLADKLNFAFAITNAPHNELLSILNSGTSIPLFYSKYLDNWRALGLHGYVCQ